MKNEKQFDNNLKNEKMKKILFSVIITAIAISTQAQSEKFTAAIKSNIAAIDTSFKNPSLLIAVANNFERIGLAEKNQWLPFYYAAYCQVMYAFMQQDPSGNDAIADRAEALINKADSLAPDNSEITSVKSMIATIRMIVNPQQRYMQYGTEANQLMEKAKQQDPTNPRPYYLQGQNLKNTPEQFGGGCKTAKPLLETAMQKYEAFKTQSDIHPNWGKQITEQLLSQCK